MPELNLSPSNRRPRESFDRLSDFSNVLSTALGDIGNIAKADQIGFRFDQFSPGNRRLNIGNSRPYSGLGRLCFTDEVQADGARLFGAQEGIVTSRLETGVKLLIRAVVLTR